MHKNVIFLYLGAHQPRAAGPRPQEPRGGTGFQAPLARCPGAARQAGALVADE